jgi:hypothetical protein
MAQPSVRASHADRRRRVEYLRDHGLSRISRRLVSSGALDVVATHARHQDILLLSR